MFTRCHHGGYAATAACHKGLLVHSSRGTGCMPLPVPQQTTCRPPHAPQHALAFSLDGRVCTKRPARVTQVGFPWRGIEQAPWGLVCERTFRAAHCDDVVYGRGAVDECGRYHLPELLRFGFRIRLRARTRACRRGTSCAAGLPRREQQLRVPAVAAQEQQGRGCARARSQFSRAGIRERAPRSPQPACANRAVPAWHHGQAGMGWQRLANCRHSRSTDWLIGPAAGKACPVMGRQPAASTRTRQGQHSTALPASNSLRDPRARACLAATRRPRAGTARWRARCGACRRQGGSRAPRQARCAPAPARTERPGERYEG